MSFVDKEIAIKLVGSAPPPSNKFSLWYRQPGTTNTTLSKSNDTLPIGNGRLGAMVQGGTEFERLQLNEESLWSGGPGGNESQCERGNQGKYNFGYNSPCPDKDEIYQKLKHGAPEYSKTTQGVCESEIQGNDGGYGNYKNFGYLELDYMHRAHMLEEHSTEEVKEIEVRNYRRELDLEDGVCRVRYEIEETTYTREYIASYPDNAIAVRISAHSKCKSEGKVNLRISATSGQPDGRVGDVLQAPKVSARDGIIMFSGGLRDNGMLYVGVFKVDTDDGVIATQDDYITVSDASSVTIYFSAITDYKNEYALPDGSELFELLTYRTGESMDELESRALTSVSTLTHEGYVEFASRHKIDYSDLFKRVKLDLGGDNNMPTDIALANYGANRKADCSADSTDHIDHTDQTSSMRMLEALLYQYGRYLLISSSREGSLLANLQGVWNSSNFPPWASDYHTNINLQMNYWAAGGANMVELIEPLANYLKSLMVTGRYTAQKYCYGLSGADNSDTPSTPSDAWKHDGAGWTTHTSSNIFGFTAPGFEWYWGWAPTAGAWISQNLYQYLQYGGDNNLFKRDYWPIIREAAIMWTKALYMPPDGFWAGKYVVVPSFSPEHGPLTIATASEQQLVWEIFTIALDCMEKLDIDDIALRADIEEKLENLYSPVNISQVTGRIMEWTESEVEFNSNGSSADTAQGHRHLNHLVGFYPGTSIANGDSSNLDAAKRTLEWKGDAATGWSMGWKINLWARVGDGNRAHRLTQNLFDVNLAKNMFGLHVLQDFTEDGYYFQIDANFGYTAGVQEMLLQSHLGSLDLLPALPDVWESGSIEGIRTIGGHTVSMDWVSGELKSATITAFADGEISVRNEILKRDNIDIKLNDMSVCATNGIISFVAKENQRYEIVILSLNDSATSRGMTRNKENEENQSMDNLLEKVVAVRPSERQSNWQALEFYAFIHYGVNSFTDREWGDGTETPAIFNPQKLDTDQWCKAIKDAGMRAVIITAKHHDGFCLFDSAYTNHSVMYSPYGKDIVVQLAESCRKYDLKLGIYLSPWDQHDSRYGSGAAYDDYFCAQLTELMTNYGELFCLWFDGACGEGPNGKVQVYDWERYYALIRKLQPEAVISIMGPDVRWCGNEAGHCRESEWSVVPAAMTDRSSIAAASQQADDASFREHVPEDSDDIGSREALAGHTDFVWYPAEVNVSTRPGWFYHPAEDDKVRSLNNLLEIYLQSVGGNATFLMNIPPHYDGYIHENDVKRLREIGEWIKSSFARNLLNDLEIVRLEDKLENKDGSNSAPCYSVTTTSPISPKYLVLKEDITRGQRIEEFTLLYQQNGKWSEAAKGTVVGHKRICKIPDSIVADKWKLRIDSCRMDVFLKAFELY